MDKALYIAMTGGKHIERAQAVHANNMANATTTGFRADFEQARAMARVLRRRFTVALYALTENPGTDFAFGSLSETGGDLDVAVDGPGWIAVQGSDGKEAYTRAGSLRINALGQLHTADGQAVLGDSGPLTFHSRKKFKSARTARSACASWGRPRMRCGQLGRIKLVNPDNAQLRKGEDGLMYLRAGEPR